MSQDATGTPTLAAGVTELAAVRAGLGAGPSYASLRLFKAPLAPDIGTTRTFLVTIECDFGGYAAVDITALPIQRIVDRIQAQLVFPVATFTASGVAPSNNVYGAWLEDHTGNLLAVGSFPQPISMALATDILDVIAQLGNPPPDTFTAL